MFGFLTRLADLESDLKKIYATKRDITSVSKDVDALRLEMKQQIRKLRQHIAASKNRNADIRRRLRDLENKNRM